MSDEFARVVKVICATNAVESSVTIDQLAAVVDSGLFNCPHFDSQKFITEIRMEPITEKMQTQRKGRVGRTRPGIAIQLTMAGKKLRKNIDPSIKTSDLSGVILQLRKIGIQLEQLDKLPDEPNEDDVNMYLNDLQECGCLDGNGKITRLGFKVSKFSTISPLFAAAIIQISDRYEDKLIAQCFGAFLVYIMTTENLIGNQDAQKLRYSYDPRSDIITCLKPFLEIIEKKKVKNENEIAEYGFQQLAFKSIYSNLKNIMFTLLSNEGDKKFNPEFWNRLIAFSKSIDINDYINEYIKVIREKKPQQYEGHIAFFRAVLSVSSMPSLIYCVNQESYSFGEQFDYGYLDIKGRPGGKGLEAPKYCYVFQIVRNRDMKKNYGTFIHEITEEDCEPLSSHKSSSHFRNDYEIPRVVQSGYFAYSDFFKIMVKAYLQDSIESK